MKQHIRCGLFFAAGTFALALSGCGSDEVAQADVVAESSSPASSVVTSEPAESVDSADVLDSGEGFLVDVQGATTAVRASCNLGLPFSVGEGDCESFGGYLIMPVTYEAQFRGTFEGSYTQRGTFAVASDGSYVFASIDTFVGTVGECGEGTVVWNSAGQGDFEAASRLPGAISRNTNWISYTAVESELSTLDVVLSADTMQTALTQIAMTGTYSCGDAGPVDELVAAVRPDSGVDPVDVLDWTGPSNFAFGPTCDVTDNPDVPTACPIVDGFAVQGLNNQLDFSGAFEGQGRFVAAQLVAGADFEHIGILIFEGLVEGCGEGTVVMVNEAIGNGAEVGFRHLRAFTPPEHVAGSLGVRLDATARPVGVVSFEMDGIYSC